LEKKERVVSGRTARKKHLVSGGGGLIGYPQHQGNMKKGSNGA